MPAQIPPTTVFRWVLVTRSPARGGGPRGDPEDQEPCIQRLLGAGLWYNRAPRRRRRTAVRPQSNNRPSNRVSSPVADKGDKVEGGELVFLAGRVELVIAAHGSACRARVPVR